MIACSIFEATFIDLWMFMPEFEGNAGRFSEVPLGSISLLGVIVLSILDSQLGDWKRFNERFLSKKLGAANIFTTFLLVADFFKKWRISSSFYAAFFDKVFAYKPIPEPPILFKEEPTMLFCLSKLPPGAIVLLLYFCFLASSSDLLSSLI